MRIALVVRQRIPAEAVSPRKVYRDESNQRRSPPTAIAIVVAARTPDPVVVVINPSPVMIWSQTSWLISDPGPVIRSAPDPVSISIRSPIVVDIYYGSVWPPDPAILRRIGPIAISVKFFGPPNVLVIVLDVVAQSLSQVAFAIVDPTVP